MHDNSLNIPTFKQRRQWLLEQMPANSIAFIQSGDEQTRNRDTSYPFRPNSDFFYLTGFSEPNALLVLRKTNNETKTLLALRAKNPERELWDGIRLGVDAAPTTLAVDAAIDISTIDTHIPEWLNGCDIVFISYEGAQPFADQLLTHINQLKRKVRLGVQAPRQLNDLDTILHEHRLIKDSAAQAGLKTAANITIAGHLAAMRVATSGAHEYEVQAALEYECRRLGAERQAFDSIIAGGKNACILHYTENRAVLNAGDLVLIDAGAEVKGYAGDCTHTFPINGSFNAAQAALYDLVLAAQQTAMACIKPGCLYHEPHQAAVNTIAQGLLDLGLLQGDLASVLEQESYKAFYMHQTGHWLGGDVHDVGQCKQHGEWRPLQAGMALTVEPGIYVSPDNMQVAPEWRGIGIRIEDSVIVTTQGYDILTQGLPRSRKEIEQWMKKR